MNPENISVLPEGKIFLLGLPGSGKSFFGKKLAEKFARPFFDLDELIEQQTGKTIIAIFGEDGEEVFRKIESDTLRSYHFSADAIVSLGGGTPCFHDNLTWLKKHGTTIYIKAALDIVAENLKGESDKRPVLTKREEKELKNAVAQLLNERESFYAQADIVWEV
jgi:shikimate kinase